MSKQKIDKKVNKKLHKLVAKNRKQVAKAEQAAEKAAANQRKIEDLISKNGSKQSKKAKGSKNLTGTADAERTDAERTDAERAKGHGKAGTDQPHFYTRPVGR